MTASSHTVAPGQRRIKYPDLTAGLYLDRSPSHVPDGGMSACNNVRIESGKLRNDFLGWKTFGSVTGPAHAVNDVLIIDEHIASDGVRQLIVGTDENLFTWDGTEFLFLTPDYSTGTATTTLGSPIVTGGTDWDVNVSVGDWFHLGNANKRTLEPTSGWVQVITVDPGGTQITLDTNMVVTNTLPYTVLNVFSGTKADIWSADMFRDAPSNEDLWIATNGSEIVKWDGAADEVTELSLGFTCKIVRYFKNTMWYGNLVISGDTFPGSVRTSALTDPENVTTLEATEIKISDESPLLALERLSDAMACYAEDSVNVVHSVDSPVFWNITTALPAIGIIGERAIVNFGNFHEFLAEDRAYRFDGVSEVEIGSHVLREVLKSIDPNRLEKAIGYIDRARGDVLWVIPLSTDGAAAGEAPVSAYVSHFDEASGNKPIPYTKRDLPAVSIGASVDTDTSLFSELPDGFDDYERTWANFSSATPLLLFGEANGKVRVLNGKNRKVGVGLISTARFARRPVIDGDRNGRVIRVEPVTSKDATATDYTLDVKVYTSDYEDGDSALAATGNFDLTQATRRFVSIGKPGRHVEIEFGSDGTLEPKDRQFQLSSFAIVASPIGRR